MNDHELTIRFRDVSAGSVEARAVIEIAPGVFLNEVTILNREGMLEVELPQKTFRGKNGKMHYMEIITFENEQQKTLWMLEVRNQFNAWRKKNKKVLVYEG